MLVLDKIARNIMGTEGIAMVQDITRPLGIPIQHSSIPFQTSMSGQTNNLNLPFQRQQLADQLRDDRRDQRLDRHHGAAVPTVGAAEPADAGLGGQVAEICWPPPRNCATIADFDDQFRPMRNYFYWEPHCFDIPMCARHDPSSIPSTAFPT